MNKNVIIFSSYPFSVETSPTFQTLNHKVLEERLIIELFPEGI